MQHLNFSQLKAVRPDPGMRRACIRAFPSKCSGTSRWEAGPTSCRESWRPLPASTDGCCDRLVSRYREAPAKPAAIEWKGWAQSGAACGFVKVDANSPFGSGCRQGDVKPAEGSGFWWLVLMGCNLKP